LLNVFLTVSKLNILQVKVDFAMNNRRFQARIGRSACRMYRTSLRLVLMMVLVFGVSSMTGQAIDTEAKSPIRGRVLDETGLPVANADLRVINSLSGAISKEDGSFELLASPNDVIVASAFLMKTQEVAVASESYITISLETNAEMLDAILLKQKNEAEKLERTPFQDIKPRSLGYNTETIQQGNFWPGDVSIYESIIRFPFVQEDQGALILQRSRGWIRPTPALVILDNVPVDQSILRQLNPDLVESVSMVRSLAGAVKYGSLGAGGVIYIRTKLAANLDLEEGFEKRFVPIAGNEYAETPPLVSEGKKESDFIKELNNATSLEQAKSKYYRHTSQKDATSMSYYLDAANYFANWDMVFSHQVQSDLLKLSNNNPKVLLGLAYHCEQLGRFPQAAYIYEELMLLQPDKLQSYLNLAKIYTKIGSYKLANTLYKQMLFNTIENLDFSVLEPLIIREYRRFLTKYRNKVNFKGLPNELLVANFDKQVRLVFEWTNPLTEFEIQFVSPENKFYTWQHSAFDNKVMIEQELASGYAIKDFVIEQASEGAWTVNINRLSPDNESVPTYVKYTIYRNYGLPDETIEMKVLPLNAIDEKVTLDAFSD
jgi:tetratricopeptide (TPR) repeat protein